MLKKPNLTAEAKSRLKNEILNALGGDKKILTSADFSVAASPQITTPPTPVKLPAPAAAAKTPAVSTATAIKPVIKIDKKAMVKTDKKNVKKQPPKEPAPFILIPEIKVQTKKNLGEKQQIGQGLGLLRFIIFLLIIIAILLPVDMFLLAGK